MSRVGARAMAMAQRTFTSTYPTDDNGVRRMVRVHPLASSTEMEAA
jgi:hypothetical protein